MNIPDRKDWYSNAPIQPYTLTVYTDGSKTTYGSGAGFWIDLLKNGRSFKPSNHATVYQSKTIVILKVGKLLLNFLKIKSTLPFAI